MPSDHETAREQRVEALAWIRADLRKLYEMGSAQRQNLSDLTRRLDQNAREIADLLEGNGLRDLLAEAKAEALERAAGEHERELVCCDVYERLREKPSKDWTDDERREHRSHAICYWGAACAEGDRRRAATYRTTEEQR